MFRLRIKNKNTVLLVEEKWLYKSLCNSDAINIDRHRSDPHLTAGGVGVGKRSLFGDNANKLFAAQTNKINHPITLYLKKILACNL